MKTEACLEIDGVRVPRFLYGTAWKEDETQRLIELALEHGFRGIDTANQRKHYFEEAVGKGIRARIEGGLVRREDLFIQTKFTFQDGQDERLPYDPQADVATQVEQSFASSQEHLGTEIIDALVLHGPSQWEGLGADDRAAWRAMEGLYGSGKTRLLGISNVSLDQLKELCRDANVQPRFVQNRCYASKGWDRTVRTFCRKHGIVYQGFSLLTANRKVLAHPDLTRIADRYARTPAQIVFRFALDVGMLPLTGTTDSDHMLADLSVFDFQLERKEIERIERVGDD